MKNSLNVKCTKCLSDNVIIKQSIEIDDDTQETFVIDDLWEAHCNDCGKNFLVVEVDSI